MSLFQNISKWTLRAVLVWGAFEAAGASYEWCVVRAEQVTQVAGHSAAMARLEQRAARAENAARAEHALVTRRATRAWAVVTAPGETLEQSAARTLREMLLQLGAQAPVVEAAQRAGLQRSALEGGQSLTLRILWREDRSTSPAILASLAQRLPDLSVSHIRLVRNDPVQVEITATTRVVAQTAPAEHTP